MANLKFAAQQALITSQVATMQSKAKPNDAWLADRAEALYLAYERVDNALRAAEVG